MRAAAPAPVATDRPDVDEDATVNHYVPRAQILASIVLGRPATALCGVTWVVEAHGGGEVHAKQAETCLECDQIYQGLPA